MEKLKNFIGGKFVAPHSREYLENIEPATGKVYSLVPNSDAHDLERAVEAANKALPQWAATPLEQRAAILARIGDLIEQHLDTLAEAESIDTGKPITLARTIDIPRAARNFRFFAHILEGFASESYEMPETALNVTLRQPVGIAGCISPWNLPLYLFTWKIAPALAAGNCVIGKPSEITPMTAFLLGKICQKAGLPPGVLNILHGEGKTIGSAIVAHPAIPAISFTGGTRTGAEIARIAAPMFKKLSLELGGKNPFIVFADADYEQALQTAIRSAFSNQGQICLCGSRIFIERRIYNRFRKDFVEATQKLTVGDPLKPTTKVGAVISKQHFEKILSYIELAKIEGGRLLTGGHPVKLKGRCKNGWFIAPTVFDRLSPLCRTNQEEIFGPVATLMPFETEEEVLEYANSVRYGLAASVWTRDLQRALRVSRTLQSGIVWVNCWMLRDLRTPFGGMKDSGVGREGGYEALRFFTEPKNVCLKY